MPPVGSLLAHEKKIAKDRLAKYLDGYLAYRHFRNQLWERVSDYRLFKKLLEDSWHGLTIQHFEDDHGDSRNEFSLLVREGRFSSEISWHGHGLQAWMQTVWFLARVSKDSTVVLDEPDVYLHADLQRKLIKMIEGLQFSQAIIATHSPEIISDVPFQNVVVVQKRERVSRAAQNATAIQNSLREMGSIHSVQLSKLHDRGVLLLVEGEDRLFLGEVAYKLGPNYFDSFSELAIQEIKGSGNWQRALGAASSLHQASGGQVETVLILDRDFHTQEAMDAKVAQALEHNLVLKFWKKKEIENYFADPTVVYRYVLARCGEDNKPSLEDITRIFNDAVLRMKEDALLSLADFLQGEKKSLKPKSAVNAAREIFAKQQDEGEQLVSLVSGKSLISELSGHCKERYDVSFSSLALCKESQLAEIPQELRDQVSHLCGRRLQP